MQNSFSAKAENKFWSEQSQIQKKEKNALVQFIIPQLQDK